MPRNAAGADRWARWRPEIQKALASGHFTIEAIEADLAAGNLRLWATDDCAIIVELVRYSGGPLVCHVRFAAGELPAILTNLDQLEVDAKAMGCTEMRVDSRAAWERLLKSRDYDRWSVTLRKEL